ncbi:hypothetical protein CANTEDRAFT_136475 [Yamadazyma tenuis ATCC 10573]|uniref:Uncharacterized protein n=1 Tax=Candida tenuis (strain ATCC 10573 / BCRC 21748 / CBS 615 / JCM 9827 / NBRC 10315 / NRRL Y-1498 / VKM Y-70) TaxID=590646 RepID=G3BEY8_CANTC|nr:uncharacterized protein CANTEDRAFT_136475 [Yamadazyma tenuis ATCC 10573]EGV59967.1 hypothetical protein CANTEDRAFT_136475 [Yamadazyma tenuis ATCC 10573]
MYSQATPKNGSLFESINLASTINDTNMHRTPLRMPPDLESVSGTSDDEELDPTEFLSSDSPELLKQPHNQKNVIDPIPETSGGEQLSGLSPQSSSSEPVLTDTIHKSMSMLDSVIQDSLVDSLSIHLPTHNGQYDSDSESPIQHLQQNFDRLQGELRSNIVLHKSALEKGSDSLNRLRDTIADNLHSLSEIQYSLNELYQRESARNKELCNRFIKWDEKRRKLLAKIQYIKSDKNSFGIKLSGLLDESTSLDSEIMEYEAKLLSLKAKRKILQTEIEDTSSVLESRTSLFVKAFKELDRNGEVAVLAALRQNGLTDEKANVLLKKIAVDVTFVKHYEKKLEQSVRVNRSSPSKPSSEKATTIIQDKPNRIEVQAYEPPTSQMGMQAYDPGVQEYEPPAHPPIQRPYTANRNSSDPYDKGFSRGFEQSEKFKSQLQHIYEQYIKPLLEQRDREKGYRSLKVDDNENTVTSKIDLVPILEFLEHKVDAYSELSNKTGKLSTIYHQYSSCWKDVCSSIRKRENDLQASIFGQREDVESAISSILKSTLDDLLLSAEYSSNISSDPESPLKRLILHEVNALLSALSIVPSVQESQVKDFKERFESKGISKTRRKDPPSYTQNLTQSISESDYLYNVSRNAIEHKVIDKTKTHKVLSKKQSNKSLNGKSFKGE